MVAAAVYNMLDVRSMHGRSRTHDVSEVTYTQPHHHFGRLPIVIHLGDFLQLSPTKSIGLIEDVNERKEDGSYKYAETPSLEIQRAISLFARIPHVFELRGTKRFKAGDPLVAFLECMRTGRSFPRAVWEAFKKTFAADNDGALEERHRSAKFSQGNGMAMYWDALARWIPQRARRDARALGVPLVFLQAADECNTIDRSAAQRLLNVPNIHKTGHMHGVLPAHIGMRVRFTIKLNSSLGFVQEQKATIVGFLFNEEDQARCAASPPGALFRPRHLPAGIWLQVDDFVDSPICEEALPLVENQEEVDDDALGPYSNHVIAWWRYKQSMRAKGLLLFKPVEAEFTWRSSETHTVKRTGFALTHANYLTSTASQGQTIRTGVTIDCARIEPHGTQGTQDADWWLRLCVMFSRATWMEDMLLLRPPPRALLEGGPPASVKKASARFEGKIAESTEAASQLAASMGIRVPE